MGLTPRWIVDDGPLDDLAMVVGPDAVAAWPEGTFFVADATRDKARGRRRTLLAAAPDRFSVCRITMGSPASATLYGHLRAGVSDDKNLAEHEAIAWALHNAADAIFVARDKGAAFQALAELGRGGAAHPADLWIWLRDEGHITPAQFEALCERTRKGDQSVRRPLRTHPTAA